MIIKRQYYTLITLFTAISSTLMGNPVISFFFKPLPHTTDMVAQMKDPQAIAHHTVHGIIQHSIVSGICATYAGYIATSDHNGEISFPRKHTQPAINILVTQSIVPIALFENTISHWELTPGEPADFYSLSESYDEKTGQYSWHTIKASLPENKSIPMTTLIIIAKPSQIIVPLETTKTIKSANLVLPSLYIKKGTDIVSNDAYLLNIRHLFRPVESKDQRTPVRLTTQLME